MGKRFRTIKKGKLTQWELNKLKYFYDKFVFPHLEELLDEFEKFAEQEGLPCENMKMNAELITKR